MADHLPPSIRYGVAFLPIRRVPSRGADGDSTGQYLPLEMVIEIAEGVNPLQAWTTLFHEVGHHMLDQAGKMGEISEGTLETFAWGMATLLFQNPGLQERLAAAMNDYVAGEG